MKPNLEDYFREHVGKAIDFRVRVLQTSESGVEFLIHPQDVNGRTANYFVRDDSVQLVSITNPPAEPTEGAAE
ncbi:MAG TPA: hypothetical protein V6D10_05885 [Trichocoleus sp.]|jgi:hypothetical protein